MNVSSWGSVAAVDAFWQRPARTEEWAFERCRDNLPASPFVQLLFVPWATLIDSERRNQDATASRIRQALNDIPPRSTLIRATVCQHIWAFDQLETFRRLGITDLFWTHATVDRDMVEGIRIHPFPLYPVRCFDAQGGDDALFAAGAPRDVLYSFVGAYDPGLYLSEARRWIFDLPDREGAVIRRRMAWHYEREVYGVAPISVEQQSEEAEDYADVLRRSVFSLCPSGSGPNSIRLWESLGFGAIPVLMSDTLRLPGGDSEWEHAVVRVPETEAAVKALPGRLSGLAQDPQRLSEMRAACRRLWQRYVVDGPERLIRPLTQTSTIGQLVLSGPNVDRKREAGAQEAFRGPKT